MEKVTNFLNKNLVLVVMIPGIVGLHWGWYRLQHNEKFVRKEDQIINDQPIFIILKRMKNKIMGGGSE